MLCVSSVFLACAMVRLVFVQSFGGSSKRYHYMPSVIFTRCMLLVHYGVRMRFADAGILSTVFSWPQRGAWRAQVNLASGAFQRFDRFICRLSQDLTQGRLCGYTPVRCFCLKFGFRLAQKKEWVRIYSFLLNSGLYLALLSFT